MLDLLKRVISFATTIEGACAIYRSPDTSKIFCLISDSIEMLNTKEALREQGFLVAPYVKNEKSVFIKKKLFVEYDFISGEEAISGNSDLTDSFQRFTDKSVNVYSSANNDLSTDKEAFLQQIEKTLEALGRREMHKVVLSKIKKVKKDHSFDPVKIFIDLVEAFPKLFVSLVNSKETGLWFGATPEILVHQNDSWFNTVALAGTQKGEELEPRDAVWRQKEIEEQAYVSRYIINCFKKIRLREFDERGPKTIKAGQLLHLKTEFWVELKQVSNSDLIQDMLMLLHPTSAVCGMPLEVAEPYVDQLEKHSRRFYAGYLGPVNIHEETTLYVNLRCCEVLEEEIVFYAGAGITEDSIAEKEWDETEMKIDTLLQFVR